ncbi:DUF3892 domain-containing protein [Curtobacterium sp. MCPF17_021]
MRLDLRPSVQQLRGRKFLKTTADTITKNNLDNLPPF